MSNKYIIFDMEIFKNRRIYELFLNFIIRKNIVTGTDKGGFLMKCEGKIVDLNILTFIPIIIFYSDMVIVKNSIKEIEFIKGIFSKYNYTLGFIYA
jgi:hypothetical protein